jgi:hypothetical protein
LSGVLRVMLLERPAALQGHKQAAASAPQILLDRQNSHRGASTLDRSVRQKDTNVHGMLHTVTPLAEHIVGPQGGFVWDLVCNQCLKLWEDGSMVGLKKMGEYGSGYVEDITKF